MEASQYWEHKLAADYSFTGVGYTCLGLRYNEWLYRVRRKVFRRVVQAISLDISAAAILDVGSGTGFYVEQWLGVGALDITGSDVTAIATERLSQRFPSCRFYRQDIGGELGDLGRRRYDVISAFDVLFHIVDDASYSRAFENIHLLLRKGGYLMFSENFVQHHPVETLNQVSRSRIAITDLLERVGFEIVGHAPMFVVMNEPLDTRRSWWRVAWKLITYPARIHESFGFLLGAILYPLESWLTTHMEESPTTELMICRKRIIESTEGQSMLSRLPCEGI